MSVSFGGVGCNGDRNSPRGSLSLSLSVKIISTLEEHLTFFILAFATPAVSNWILSAFGCCCILLLFLLNNREDHLMIVLFDSKR